MKGLSLFPTLTDELYRKIGVTIPLKMSCFHIFDHKEFFFESDGSMNSISLVSAGWDPGNCALGIKAEYKFANPKALFGSNGVACKDATLGLAVLWKSKDSRQRGTIHIGSITYTSQECSLKLARHMFNNGQFRGKLVLETVLYLQKAGTPEKDETILSNIPGTVYGSVDVTEVFFDGTGGICQTYINPVEGGPLWRVVCDFDDPLYDDFYESVIIENNPLNPGYQYIDPKSSSYKSEMLREILAEQMCTILLTIRSKCSEQQWNDIASGNSNKDSIGDITLSLMRQGVDLSSPTACAETIRKHIMKEKLDR